MKKTVIIARFKNLCKSSLSASSTKEACIDCPPGSYCATESKTPSECPQGKFNPTSGVQSKLGCKSCPAGSYCPKMGLVTPVPCPDGFVCPPGTKSLGDVDIPCPKGSYCRGGTKKTKCPGGSYQDQLAQDSQKLEILNFFVVPT